MTTNQNPSDTATAVHETAAPTPGGFPSRIALALSRIASVTHFVETGTYLGGTTRWASANFRKVYTIERSEQLYAAHQAGLRSLGNVEPMLGDSKVVLRKILPDLHTQPALFWLDGHWSGAETAGLGDECPLLGELALLSGRTDDIVFIDDARLFLSAPPLPHDPRQWPTVAEVVAALSAGARRPFIQIVDDAIISIPDTPALRECLTAYAQERAGIYWTNYARIQSGVKRPRGLAGLWDKIRSLVGVP